MACQGEQVCSVPLNVNLGEAEVISTPLRDVLQGRDMTAGLLNPFVEFVSH
jgi:hypothetical protein